MCILGRGFIIIAPGRVMCTLEGEMVTKNKRDRAGEGKAARLEGWLVQLSGHLGEQGIETRLAYDDRRGGDWLVLRILLGDQGYAELLVRRQGLRATLYLAADGRGAAERLREAVEGLHRQVKRRRNARRKFLHRAEQMAADLAQTFDARAADFPAQKLELLLGLVPSALPMTGIKGTFRQKLESGEQGDDRFPTIHAARVETPQGPRLIPYDRQAGGFRFRGATALLLTAAVSAVGIAALSQYAVADEQEGQQRGEWLADFADGALDVADAADLATEGTEVALEIGADAAEHGLLADLDCIDLPDCDLCDVPDCAF